MDGMQV
ncbi:uncharacterized protein DNG_06729 [Cephalotrichum gorgonifer]|nr:uncharacterized protein DNG_06729 [Cephalotrichum gorgonifer]